MPFVPSVRNYKGVPHETLRKQVDGVFNQAHDELSVAYYDHWRYGGSHSWHGYDVQPTPKESKALFDNLHGLIHMHYTAKFHEENMKLPEGERIPTGEYDCQINMITNQISDLKDRGIEIKL